MLLEKILQSTHETLNELASLIRQRALCSRIARCQVLTTVHFGATHVCPEEVVLGDELVVEVFED